MKKVIFVLLSVFSLISCKFTGDPTAPPSPVDSNWVYDFSEISSISVDDFIINIEVFNNYLYIMQTSKFEIYDLSNLNFPELHSSYSGYVISDIVKADELYFCYPYQGVEAIEYNNENELESMGTYQMSDPRLMEISGDILYVMDYDDGLKILSVANPVSIFELSGYDYINYSQEVRNLHYVNNFLYVMTDYGFSVLDVSNNYYPELVHEESNSGTYDCVIDYSGTDVYLYMAQFNGISVYNNNDSNAPFHLNDYSLPETPLSMIAYNNRLICALGSYGIQAVKFSAGNLTQLEQVFTYGSAEKVLLYRNKFLLVYCYPDLVEIYEIRTY